MSIIQTTKGDFEEAVLVKKEGIVDNENEYTTWVEYRLPDSDEIIHRSAHVTLKKNVSMESTTGGFVNG